MNDLPNHLIRIFVYLNLNLFSIINARGESLKTFKQKDDRLRFSC